MCGWIAKLLIVTSIHLISGWKFCSKSKEPAHCLPCSKNGTDVYKCPKGCMQDSGDKQCNITCSDRCVHSKCAYDEQGLLTCMHGCVKPFTGPYCQETCAEGCTKCSQDSKQCLQCQKGRFGDSCERKCSSCKHDICDIKGLCEGGCVDGYFGPLCDKKCPARCGQCVFDSGQCTECVVGWFGENCQSDCRNCKNKRCGLSDGVCTEGCESGYILKGKTCQRVVAARQEEPAEEKMSGLASIFQEEDYLLPIVGCLLVILVVVAAVVFWKCRRSLAKEKQREKEKAEADAENGKCNVFSHHPSLKRVIAESPSSDPLYKDVVEEAIRTHSCEEILKKHNLLDPNRPRFENKSLASLRNRTGNLSVPFMQPIEEDEEEVEFEEEDGVHMPNVGIIFTLEPPDEDSASVSIPDAASMDVPSIKTQDESGSSFELPATDPAGDLFILQRGNRKDKGDLSVSFDYMDSSYSGNSTPMQPEMYSKNPHSGENLFSRKLSDHLDTYLTKRSSFPDSPLPNVSAGNDVHSSESDSLLRSNSVENNKKADSRFPKKSLFNGYKDKVIVNGDSGTDLDHIAFASEKQPMLSLTSDSNV